MIRNVISSAIKQNLPNHSVTLAFGYGSAVVKQANTNSSGLIDIIIAVDDPLAWHYYNVRKNFDHYSFLRTVPRGHFFIDHLQQHYGAKIYYNTYVSLGTVQCKYGVIKTDHLLDDLTKWETLYVAGRLHKPTQFYHEPSDPNETLKRAIDKNHEFALNAALLKLPERFTLDQLYAAITSLSYDGDLRMLFGEKKNKVKNIVAGQRDLFAEIYKPILGQRQEFKEHVYVHDDCVAQNKHPEIVRARLKSLPETIRNTIAAKQRVSFEDEDELLRLSQGETHKDIVAKAIRSVVRKSSTTQSLKGILTAGPQNAALYAYRKWCRSLERVGIH